MQPHGAVRSTFFVSVICFPVLSATSNLPPFTLRQGVEVLGELPRQAAERQLH
jgi:hypothetical protein